jgi:uncharacterized protein DUF5819
VYESEQRSAFAAVASLIAGIHMLAVTLAAIPTNPVSDALDPQLDYLTPFFGQSWRLFAPNPIDEDKSLLVQGAYVDSGGKLRVTPWVDWTTVEQDVIEHRLIGGRAGYITTKFYPALDEEFRELESPEQRSLSQRSSPLAPPPWSALKAYLAQVGPDDDDLADYLRYDRAAARLATNVVDARWPKRDLNAVRYALREHGVVPFDARHGDKAERQAARPAPTVRIGGWRPPTYGSAAEGRGVAEFDGRHG